MHLLKYQDKHVNVHTGQVGIAGEYRIEVMGADGRCRWLTDWFSNHITDTGLDWCATNVQRLNACQVGSGNAAPQDTDVTLETHVAGTTTKVSPSLASSGTSGPAYYGQLTVRYDFASGAVNGNISEVGIGISGSAGQPLFSRELLRDGNGDPTTLTVLSQETLRVYYRLRHYCPVVDNTYQINVGGITQHSIM